MAVACRQHPRRLRRRVSAGLLNLVPLIEETAGGGTRVSYDSVASAIGPYGDPAASEVARRLDAEVLGLLRQTTGAPPNLATSSAGR
jgi:hypothetical protein